MKKGLILVASLLLLVGCGSNTPAATATPAPTEAPVVTVEPTEAPVVALDLSALKDGTYEGTAAGYAGDVVATVVLKGGVIESIVIVADKETAELGGNAVSELPTEMVITQSVDVDSWTGATVTSDAIKEAVTAALELAK